MKWEYLRVQEKRFNQDSDSFYKTLNEMGEEGWELVGVSVTNHGGEVYYFKRPKSNSEKPAGGN